MCQPKFTIDVAPCFILRANRYLVDTLHNNGLRHSFPSLRTKGTKELAYFHSLVHCTEIGKYSRSLLLHSRGMRHRWDRDLDGTWIYQLLMYHRPCHRPCQAFQYQSLQYLVKDAVRFYFKKVFLKNSKASLNNIGQKCESWSSWISILYIHYKITTI
jgi:hypothetical protein